MRASIQQDNDTILSDIEVTLETTTPQSGLGSWSGVFFGHQNEIDPGNFRLLLEDGRSGNIAIVSISDDGVYFLGSGPLA